MNFKKSVIGTGFSLLMLTILVSQSTGVGPSSWSYRIASLSSSALSDDGERFLVGCENGEYFVFDRFGNVILNDIFSKGIHAVDIAENGNMIFGIENGFIFLDSQGKEQSKVYPTEPVLHVSIAKNGLYAVAGTQREIFLMNTRELIWRYKIEDKDLPELPEILISKALISESGSVVAVVVEDVVLIFNLASHRIEEKIDVESTITSLAILPDENEIAIGTEEKTFFLYDIEGNEKFRYSLEGSINSIEVNSEHILVGTSKGEIVLFNQDRGILQKLETEGSVIECDISDDGKFMIVLDSEGNVSFFNAQTEEGWEYIIQDPLSVELSEDGKYIGITGENGIYFFNNWENAFDGTGYFPYASHGSFSLESDLQMLWFYPVEGIGCFDYGDINGDGRNEIVLGSGTELVVLNYRGSTIWKKSFPAKIEIVRLLDLTEDAVPEILIGFDDGKLNIDVWNGEGEHLINFDFMNKFQVTPRPGDISMEPIMAMDIDQDGVVEIISEVRIGYPMTPGGIFVFEYPSGEEQWFYPIAPFLVSCALTDINNDDNLELVLGSFSLCKGTAVGKRDDCHVYIIVVDLQGNEIWVEEIASRFRKLLVAVSDLDGDGQKEIVGTVGSLDDTYGKLFILDNKGNYINKKEFDYSVWMGGVADFKKDGSQEIVVTDSKGRVVMYDCNLTHLRDFEIEQDNTPYVKGIADLDGNGTLEIVSVTNSGKLIILDRNLNELTSIEVNQDAQVAVVNISGCALDILVHSPDRIRLYSMKNERARLCPLIWGKGYPIDPYRYFVIAETHYKNLEFEKARENFEKAKILYEKAGIIGVTLESTRMIEKIENFRDALSKVDSGEKKLTEGDFENARYDFLEAKILFDRLLQEEEFQKVKEWFQTHINECEYWLKACDEVEKAFENLKNGEEGFKMQQFERAKEYFESALQTFDKYGLEQFSQKAHEYIEKSNKCQKEILEKIETENMTKKYRSAIILLFCVISLFIVSVVGIHLHDITYRNENYSILNSLLYTFHIRGFPIPPHIKEFPIFSQIENPYYAGKPVRDEAMFFGREDVNEFLKYELTASGRNTVIILHGERKTGKTSILYQIEDGKLNPGPEFIPVYIDMNRMTINDDYEFLSHLISLIQEAVKLYRIRIPTVPFEKKGNPYLFFKDIFLQNVANSAGKRRILFLIDEYEAIEKKITEGKLSRDVFGFLKSVVEQEVGFNFIFAGSRKIEEFVNRDEWLHALSSSVYRKISFLKKENAIKLIKDPVTEKVWYTNRAVKELLDLSGCHPYLLQYFCFILVNLLNETESLNVDIKEVKTVMQDVIENPMPQMILLWTSLTQDQQILVSFLAESIQKKNGSMSEGKIINELKKRNITFSKDIYTIFHDLEAKGILKRKKKKCSFCIGIFRQFIAQYHPFSRAFQEAEHEKPLLE